MPDGSTANSAQDLVDCFTPRFFSLRRLTGFLSVISCLRSTSCEGELSVEECLSALQGMAHRKAPGNDGLPMEFCVKFWYVLGSDLVKVLNFCLVNNKLSKSKRRGVISLSFKKGDSLDPKNGRPISLLNVDYKTASRAIAGSLLKILHAVVDKDQTCGVPGQFIGENVAYLRDVIDYASQAGVPCAILPLHQEKAFDRVDWGFMRDTFSAMSFGPPFISSIDIFYRGSKSAVNANGHIS